MKAKIAFIGCGRMASIHATALNKIPGVEITGVYDIIKEKAKDFAEKFGAKKVYASRAELLQDKEVTAVAICDYGHQHADELFAVMESGIRRIFCEKPAIRQLSEANKISDMAKKTKTLVCVGHVRRYFAGQLKMKEIIESGILGKILFAKVHCCNSTFSREWGTYFSSFEQSGGTALDMGVHYVDLFNWFFGKPTIASAKVLGMEEALPPDSKPCDYFSGNLVYENGVICGLETSYQRHGERSDLIEIYGETATLLYDKGVLKVYTKDSVSEYKLPTTDHHLLQMQAFVKMIEDGTHCSCMQEDGILSAGTILGMLESSASNTFYDFRKRGVL